MCYLCSCFESLTVCSSGHTSEPIQPYVAAPAPSAPEEESNDQQQHPDVGSNAAELVMQQLNHGTQTANGFVHMYSNRAQEQEQQHKHERYDSLIFDLFKNVRC